MLLLGAYAVAYGMVASSSHKFDENTGKRLIYSRYEDGQFAHSAGGLGDPRPFNWNTWKAPSYETWDLQGLVDHVSHK